MLPRHLTPFGKISVSYHKALLFSAYYKLHVLGLPALNQSDRLTPHEKD